MLNKDLDIKIDRKKQWLVVLIIAIILLGVSFRLLSLNKDITAEETDFIGAAKSIANSGHPIFYQSEQFPIAVALWHPPMYISALSNIIIFSTSEIAIRSLNVLAILLTSVIIFCFCSRLIEKNGKIIGLVSSALFLINYYVLSSSLLIDIDAFSTLFLFSFIFFIILAHKNNKSRYYLLAAISFLFSLANRYPIAIIVFCAIFIYLFLKKETRQFSYKYFLTGIVSGLVFLLIWLLYSTIIEPGTFFSFISHNVNLGAAQFKSLGLYLASFFLNTAQIIRLFTLPAVILFILAFFYLVRRKEEWIRILFVYVLATLLLFIIVPRPAFGYPRYFLTLTPGFFILISIYLGNFFENIKIKIEYLILGAIFLIASLLMLILFNPQPAIYINSGLIKATNLPDFIFNVLCIFPLVIVLIFKKRARKFVLVLGLVAIFLSYNLYFDIKYVAYNSHTKEVGEYLRAHTTSEDIIICPKAVGYYYGRGYYFNDYYKPQIDKLSVEYFVDYIKKSYENPKMDSEFFWGDDIYGGVYVSNYTQPDERLYGSKYIVTNYLSADNAPEKIIGEFYIYRMKE